ncbi:HAD family phosphatase [Candidatus Woesearchaeota archaeon]|nr:HAD family phosphatase [Candidatus Woesearchaeota archaeon]
MSKIRSAAFDLEGTVVDVETAHHQGHILAARDIGVNITLEESLKKLPHCIGGPTEKVAEDICKLAASEYGIIADVNDVLASTRRHYDELLRNTLIMPRHGFTDFFYAAQNAGLECSIGSLTDEKHALILLERSGLLKLFNYDHIVLKEHVKNLKPAPDVWIETAKRTNVAPDEQMVFEDSPRGIQGAIKVGAYCIGMPVYNKPEPICALAQAGAKRIFMDWQDINPSALLKNVAYEHAKQ